MSSKSRPALLPVTAGHAADSGPREDASARFTQRITVTARALALLAPLLEHRRATLYVVGIALTLSASALTLGFTADDHFHALSLGTHHHVRGVARPAWDLFAFAKNQATNAALMEEGAFPWWTDRELVIAFLRPLSSFSLWLDHTLWPSSAFAMHLHSLIWYGALLYAASRVFRAFIPELRVCALALLIYGIDDARSMPLAWIAHRNALIALTPAFLAIAAHRQYRLHGGLVRALTGPVCFAIGLAGGEPALPAFGYLVAYALFLEEGSAWARLRTLSPYVGLVLAWRVLYNALGYGALHSGVYLDPGREPLAFAHELLIRMPVLLLSQFALPIADLWEVYPLFLPFMQPLVLAFGVVVLAALGYLFAPLLRSDRSARFWLAGAVLSAIPVCGTHPEDRVLTATSLGAAALIARFLYALARSEASLLSPHARAAGALLVAVHLVIAPVLLPARVLAMDAMEKVMLHADRGIVESPKFAEETLVMVNPPVDLLAVYWPVYRAARGMGTPRHFRWLATGESAIAVGRIDAHTLRVRPERGFLASASQQMFRRAERGIPLDGTVELEGVRFQVTDLTRDGRPAEVLVHFDLPLDHASLRFVQWGEHEYVPFPLPREGETVVIPAVDMQTALLEEPRPLRAPPSDDHRPTVHP